MCVAPLDITLLLDYHALIIPSLHRDIHGCTPIRPIRLELPEEMRYKEDPYWRDHVYIGWSHSSSASL